MIARLLLEDDSGQPGQSDKVFEKVLNHPLVKGLSRKPGMLSGKAANVPDYIPSSNFTSALLDVLGETGSRNESETQPAGTLPSSIADLRKLVDKVRSIDLQRALRSLTSGASTMTDASKRIEAWFDQAMDRSRGWYARRTQTVILIAAVLVVVAINADTVMIADHLWKDSELRSKIVAAAAETVARQAAGEEALPGPTAETEPGVEAAAPSGTDPPQIATERSGEDPTPANDAAAGQADEDHSAGGSADEDEAAENGSEDAPPMSSKEAWRALEGFPIGWSSDDDDPRSLPDRGDHWLMKIAGLLITIFSVSLGAPFWFDLLNRLVSIRSSGKPLPTASDKEREQERVRAGAR